MQKTQFSSGDLFSTKDKYEDRNLLFRLVTAASLAQVSKALNGGDVNCFVVTPIRYKVSWFFFGSGSLLISQTKTSI